MTDHLLFARLLVPAAAGFLLSCTMPPPTAPVAAPQSFDRALVAQGAQLAAIGNCVSCHTARGGKPFAGGYPLKTPFGTVHGTNITPDPETGIGRWSEADFSRALREGRDPQGRHYYPAFPYEYFTRISDDDVRALYAFFMTREPVKAAEPVNTMIVPRFAVAFWKSRYFEPGRFRPLPERDAQWNRGAYLVGALAHCSACHTPRDKLGGEKKSEYMSGGEVGGWHAPALNDRSPSPVPWSADSLAQYLGTGLTDGHAITAGPMEGVVENLGQARSEAVRAIAVYTAALDTRSRQDREKHLRDALRPSGRRASDRSAGNGAVIYAGACGDCHDRGRDKEGGALPLPLAIALSLPTPANLIHITRDGILPREHESQRWMPEFGTALTEEQIADLAVYLRTLTDKPAWQDVRAEVRKLSRGGE